MFRKPLTQYALVLSLLFLVVFPKGGIKIGGIPITWGYLFLAFFALFSAIHGRFSFSRNQMIGVLCWLPFQIVSLCTLLHNGAVHSGYCIAFIVTFFFLPFSQFILLGEYTSYFFSEKTLNLLRKCILFVTAYGIVTFLLKTLFGYFLHIPLLTMNYSDLATFESSKCIERGSLFKLISTYTNGNLYGVCLLILAPLYYQIETRSWPRFLIRLSFLLTLSRTVWVGHVIFEILYFLFFTKKKPIYFLYLGVLVSGIFVLISLLLPKITDVSLTEFVFDSTLGGRLSEEKWGIVPSLFSDKPFLNIAEIVYMGMIENFGMIGLSAYLIGLLSPIVIWGLSPHLAAIPHHRAVIMGLINYMILSFSDGCILLIPTMAFYFGLSSALLATPSDSKMRDRSSFIS